MECLIILKNIKNINNYINKLNKDHHLQIRIIEVQKLPLKKTERKSQISLLLLPIKELVVNKIIEIQLRAERIMYDKNNDY